MDRMSLSQNDNGMPQKSTHTLVSVIIPAFNEAENIGKCIMSILHCDLRDAEIEILVVDNGSVDGTAGIAEKLGARVFVSHEKTVAGLRNLGAKNANGEILAFLDADCTVSGNWINAAKKHLEDKRVAIAGARLKAPPEGNWFEKVWARHLMCTSGVDGYVRYINSGNMFIKKRIFSEIDGFSEHLESNEDVDICEKATRAGYAVLHSGEIEATHWGYPKNILSFMKREVWHGAGDTVRNFPRVWRSKPLMLSVYNCLCVMAAIIGLFHASNLFAFVCLLAMLLPPIMLSMRTAKKLGKYEKIEQLVLLYSAYSIARTAAFLKVGIKKVKLCLKKYNSFPFGGHYPPIIVYHRLCEQSTDKYSITHQTFHQHLEFLKANKYRLLTIDDYVDALNSKNIADMGKCVLITFDDGHASDYDLAWPLLRKFGFQATFFITTDWTGKPGYMTGDQIKALSASGMSIQSHAKSHVYLNAKGVDIDYELTASKAALEQTTGQEIRFLSFPGGRYNREVLQAATKAGYGAVCCSVPFYFTDGECPVIGRSMIKYQGRDTNFQDIVNAGRVQRNAMQLSYAIKLALKRILGNEFYHTLWSFYNRR